MATAILDLDKRPIHIPRVTSYHKIKTENGFKLGSAYMKRHYSMIDAEVYFCNEFVEEISDIGWSIQQNTMPLFGFNSYTYDEVAQGARTISGQFSMKFISPNYLFKLLEIVSQGTTISNMESYVMPVPEKSVKEGLLGSIETTYQGTIENSNHAPIWPQTFDIDVIFGAKTGISNPVHVILEGVKITGCSIGASGQTGMPVAENYSFLAKDIRTIEE